MYWYHIAVKQNNRSILVPNGNINNDLLLIIDTSLAPSPIDRVTAFLCFLTNSTTIAFCSGVTRQHITAERWINCLYNWHIRKEHSDWIKY
jgi:hypothetical protein